jgi:hypothetical protein
MGKYSKEEEVYICSYLQVYMKTYYIYQGARS